METTTGGSGIQSPIIPASAPGLVRRLTVQLRAETPRAGVNRAINTEIAASFRIGPYRHTTIAGSLGEEKLTTAL
jgi:hypothetical protein